MSSGGKKDASFDLNAVAELFVVRVSHTKNLPSLSSSAQDSFEAMREAILIHMGQVRALQCSICLNKKSH